MRKNRLLALVIGVALLGAVGLAFVPHANASPSTPSEATPQSLTNSEGNCNSQYAGIWVTGEGKVTVVPDVAILSLGVEAQAPTVQQAMDEAAIAMDRVMAALRANGVAEKDIQTQWFNIYPVRDWIDCGTYPEPERKDCGREVLIGYRVTNTVSAKIRDVEATGSIIDRVAEAGGDSTRIQGVSFTVDDPSQYHGEARQKAMADAKAKAQQLADLAGVDLGRPFYISESGGFVPFYRDYGYGMLEASAVPPTPISPGETEVTLTVQIAFAIE
jgi:uncharacterized protein YggE